MKRFVSILLGVVGLATPATAWEFAETNVCTLSHVEGAMAVAVVFDPATSLYTITLTRSETVWAESPEFRLRFDGPSPLVIGTDRHVLSPDGLALSVTDTGFGNVLDGLQRNAQMTAMNGGQEASVSTMDAPDPVAAFRACPSAPTS